jgi:hypothetical protein
LPRCAFFGNGLFFLSIPRWPFFLFVLNGQAADLDWSQHMLCPSPD